MSDEMKKEDLVKRGVELGLGTEEFLSKVEKSNLKGLIDSVEDREDVIGELRDETGVLKEELASRPELSKEAAELAKRMEKVTTVSDLVKQDKIKVSGK